MQRKETERREARRLRRRGWSVRSICKELSVAKSSVSKWVADIPQPYQFTEEARAERKRKQAARVAKVRSQRKPKGRVISGDGRWMIWPPNDWFGKTYINGYYIYEHIYIMEKHIGRKLEENEVVHHKNGNKLDNRIKNLEVMNRKSHNSLHAKKGITYVILKCGSCGDDFKREKRQAHPTKSGKHFCSRKCAYENQRK